MTPLPRIYTSRPRSRLPYALLGLAVFAFSYTILWDEGVTSGERRQFAYIDDSANSTGSQFEALVKPSGIDSSIHSRLPPYNENDKDDTLCDDVLLFMPHTLAYEGHGRQLNSYLLAALIATHLNKAMVILETPQSEFKMNSQFGCPPEAWLSDESGRKKVGRNYDFPTGLSRLVKHPTWLSSNCSIPCQDTYNYENWDNIRTTRKNSPYYPQLYTPQEVKCKNDNGRETKVLVVGGTETRDYFVEHFKERMLQRPSTTAYGWAMRLGAEPQEAEVFSGLEDEKTIWNYASALIAHSGLLQFQPWIARDVEAYIKKSNLPLDSSYDVIHVRRGDKLKAEETKPFVDNYWTVQGTNPIEYIPFTHYLSQFHSDACNSVLELSFDEPSFATRLSYWLLRQTIKTNKARLVYVATDDPQEVQREIDELPKDEDGNTIYHDGCHKFQFIFSPAKLRPTDEGSAFHLHAGPANRDCGARYERNIASIADMMIAAKSKTFVGEFNSNWGRLVRIFRTQLNDTADSDRSPVIERETRVAWGDQQPLPPGL